MSDTHKGLPVSGYSPQPDAAIALVNRHKAVEESILRVLDEMATHADQFDMRWLAIGRTQLEQAFMALNRAVFRPGRVALPEDAAE